MFYFLGRVPPRLPREYGWPIPEKLLQWNFFRRRNLETSEEDLEAGLSRQPSQHRDWNSFSRKDFSWNWFHEKNTTVIFGVADVNIFNFFWFTFSYALHSNIFFSLFFPPENTFLIQKLPILIHERKQFF